MKTTTTFTDTMFRWNKTLVISAIFAFFLCGVVWSQSLSIDEMKRRITPAHEILQEYEKLKFDMTPAGIKAAEEREAEEARIAAEAERKRREAEAKAAAEREEREREEAIARANAPVNFYETIQKSGFRSDNPVDFARYGGNAQLQVKLQAAERDLNRVDAFDKPAAQERVNVVRAEIQTAINELAQKTFFTQSTYSTSNVKAGETQSSCTIDFQVGFFFANKDPFPVSFPMSSITVHDRSTSSGWRVVLSVSGDTVHIQELVRNSKNYFVRIHFKNFRYKPHSVYADILKVEVIQR
jgi:hypothetical protein